MLERQSIMTINSTQNLPSTGRLLCLDVGEKWIGLAISDSGQKLASPRPALQRGKWKNDADFFSNIISQENIAGIVVGNPLTLKGTVGPSADAARSYADLIGQHSNLPIALWDERLSTAGAHRALFEQRKKGSRQTRASKKDVKNRTDSAAAVLILQNVLDFLEKS